MTNTTNSVRVTKVQKYEAIKKILEQVDGSWDEIIIEAPRDKDGNKTKDDTVLDTTTLMEFCDAEIALLSRKSSNSEKRQTPRQKENEDLKEKIMEYMAQQTEGKTCTEIIREMSLEDSDGEPIGNQRVARLMKALKDAGRVTKNIVKNTPYFRMA